MFRIKIFTFINEQDWAEQLMVWLGQTTYEIVSIDILPEDSEAFLLVSDEDAKRNFEVKSVPVSQTHARRHVEIRNAVYDLSENERNRLISHHVCYKTISNMGEMGRAREYFVLFVFERN